jgi:hypothetical protein
MRSGSLRKSVPAKKATSNSTLPRSRKADASLETKSPQRIVATNPESASRAGLTQHNPPKQTRDRVPPPQRERILQEYSTGKSISDISKQEKRNRETIGKIVHGPEMQAHVWALRESWFGLGSDAISAVRHSLTVQKDGRLGFQILASIGVVPSQEERQLLTTPPPEEETEENMRVVKMIAQLMNIKIQEANILGRREPELEEGLRKVGGKINYERGTIEPVEKKSET